jgi:hypothetical protein
MGNLPAEVQHLLPEGTFAQAIAQSLTVEQFRDGLGRTSVSTDVKDRNDVGMAQGGSDPGFLFKAVKTHGIVRPEGGEYFDRHIAFQRGVAGAVHFAHSARAERRSDLIRVEARPRD